MRSTASRWATTASPRSSPAGSHASARPPRLGIAMGKRSRRRGEADEATAAPRIDGAGPDDPARTPAESTADGAGPAAAPARGGAPQGDVRLRQAMDYVEEADML